MPCHRREFTAYQAALIGVPYVCPEVTHNQCCYYYRRVLDKIQQLYLAIVTLELDIARMESLELLNRVMDICPTRVVLVNGGTPEGMQATLEGLRLGAVDFIVKNDRKMTHDLVTFCTDSVSRTREASRIWVIRSLQARKTVSGRGLSSIMPTAVHTPSCIELPPESNESLAHVVVIGAPTGGPTALCEILHLLPAAFPLAVLIIQHISAAFTAVLAEQLSQCPSLLVREASDGDVVERRTVLIAPVNYHTRLDIAGVIRLSKSPSVAGHRPTIDVAMQSAVWVWQARVQAVVFKGMGSNGTQRIVAVHAVGGRTFAQKSTSCVADGIRQRAPETDRIEYVDILVRTPKRLDALAQTSQRNAAW